VPDLLKGISLLQSSSQGGNSAQGHLGHGTWRSLYSHQDLFTRISFAVAEQRRAAVPVPITRRIVANSGLPSVLKARYRLKVCPVSDQQGEIGAIPSDCSGWSLEAKVQISSTWCVKMILNE